jgi:hypothetical protein
LSSTRLPAPATRMPLPKRMAGTPRAPLLFTTLDLTTLPPS